MTEHSATESTESPPTPEETAERIAEWSRSGILVDTPDGQVFVKDVQPITTADNPPLLILHGFPTCSYDFRPVLSRLAANRRVILFDQLGFGLSEKPDRRYGISLHADTAQAVLSSLEIGAFDLLTHDMGDSVGGELLARHAEGSLPATIGRRVITNGSIYLSMAQLTTGQNLLMSLPDEATDPIPTDNFLAGVLGTFAPESITDPVDSAVLGQLAEKNGGLKLMARLIRYLEDRQESESRYTGAIETHSTPLHIVWGDKDPVAVVEMSTRLAEARPDATIEILEGVGHYPMIEAPERFAAAVLNGLS